MRAVVAALLGCVSSLAPLAASALDVERAEVRAFIDEVTERNHLERAWVTHVLVAAESRAPILEAMNRPAERVKAWHEYRRIFLTEQRVREGRDFYASHRRQLDDVAARTGVPGAIVSAIVGVETLYGRQSGRWRVVDALATLAFDYPARSPYFRGELEQFLLLAREMGTDPLVPTGSYAGAMGAPQFMPRSYRAFGRDGDGDGRIDLWNDWPDIIESVANYFVTHGWRADEPIVTVAELGYPDVEGLPGNRLELSETLGSLRAKSVEFDTTLADDAPAMFIALRDAAGPTYRVGFRNFWVITRYNHSAMYALAVSELAAAIVAAPAPPVREAAP